jgi:site-specific DNA-methyltransferase (adenine-specific)
VTKKSEFKEKIFGGPVTPEAKKYEGSYGGFQPKPAVEVILVAMKPLSEKGYTDQALANGKGITWLDDCRIPYADYNEHWSQSKGVQWSPERKWNFDCERQANTKGRFPANLLVSDDVLGKHSKFFSLDAWWAHLNVNDLEPVVQDNLPFMIVPKASKKEKNAGCDGLEEKKCRDNRKAFVDNAFQRGETLRKNNHPTVKPLKLISYLITLGSREGDVVLDPYCGSGTTCIAALELNRKSIGIEVSDEYYNIACQRIRCSLMESRRNQKKVC